MNESPQTLPPAPYDDEIDLRELFRVLWAGKWLIGAITFAATVIAIVVALMLPNVYRAEALLAPNDRERAGGLSALAAQYGGLASLAGINVGAGQVNKTAMGLEILKSRKFISEFIERHDLLVPLMAVKGWNAETGQLRIDVDVYDPEADKWVRDAGSSRNTAPSALEAYEVFSEMLIVGQHNKTGFVTIAIEHYSAMVAKQWVDWLVDDLNSSIMHQDVAEAEQAIEYLHQQIASTSVAGLRSVFFNLIEEQTKTIMLAKVSSEYLLKTLDPAVVPEKKSKPTRSLIVILTALLGFFISVVLVLIYKMSSARGR